MKHTRTATRYRHTQYHVATDSSITFYPPTTISNLEVAVACVLASTQNNKSKRSVNHPLFKQQHV
eukprot:m.54527 g.54527  ORF g.54527 m.54527 type:complete len:65 (-) comp9199_c0_seq4:2689-2883(-)